VYFDVVGELLRTTQIFDFSWFYPMQKSGLPEFANNIYFGCTRDAGDSVALR